MRHQFHDYSLPGAYFVTFIRKDRLALLATINEGTAVLTTHGQILSECWYDLPRYFEGVVLDAFQIMPDHAHAILIFTAVIQNGAHMNPPFTLSKVIKALKSNSARRMDQQDAAPGRSIWQDGFMDRVIRSEMELEKFRATS